MDDYPLIADHGLIGDLQTARSGHHGRVASTGSARPGSTHPASSARCSTTTAAATSRCARPPSGYTSKQLYFPDTAILITRFMTEDGVGEVVDFMPTSRQRRPTDQAPHRPHGALRPRPDDVRPRHRAPLRLRARAARDAR